LRNEVSLIEKKATAVAVCLIFGTLEVWAFSWQTSLWPKTTFPYDLLHPFKPSFHGGVVLKQVKGLWLPI
jgi:hypothetical protein